VTSNPPLPRTQGWGNHGFRLYPRVGEPPLTSLRAVIELRGRICSGACGLRISDIICRKHGSVGPIWIDFEIAHDMSPFSVTLLIASRENKFPGELNFSVAPTERFASGWLMLH
jgi:hypothetical protein